MSTVESPNGGRPSYWWLKERSLNAVRVGAALGAMLFVSVVFAWVLFPDYPGVGPHELVANGLLLPAAAGAGLYLFRRFNGHRHRRALVVSWMLLGSAVVGCDYRTYAQPLRNTFPVTTRNLL